eukprot:CAMPEP_0176122888 /NCGR_PEP_ID=MMETSP0120_2-20121206/61902_1 /TAXON_ID=160619 /ORGANISM="Kryptoperidinium foliaceum, Strain CCMP 1326" /LENGTH=113 /DNA_ID=CAMNT_0017457537 /DNA_START=1 /DNA_END=339 /DNA_ORIENTATION=-
MLGASHGLLVEALGEVMPPGLERLVSVEGYARVVGMLDLTTKCLERPCPLNPRLKAALEDAPLPVRTQFGKFTLAWMRARNAANEDHEPTAPDTSDDDGDGGRPGTADSQGTV